MKKLIIVILLFVCSHGMAQQWESNLIGTTPITTELTRSTIPINMGNCQPIVPFEKYYDTVSVKFLVTNELDRLFVISGFEVYENTYVKGKGWEQLGMSVSMDCDKHLRYLLYRLDIYGMKLYNLTVWQTK